MNGMTSPSRCWPAEVHRGRPRGDGTVDCSPPRDAGPGKSIRGQVTNQRMTPCAKSNMPLECRPVIRVADQATTTTSRAAMSKKNNAMYRGIEGFSDGSVPDIFARLRHPIDEDSRGGQRRGNRRDAPPGPRVRAVGPSSGAHLIAARQLLARYLGLRHGVTFFSDEGEKYTWNYFLGTRPADRGRTPGARIALGISGRRPASRPQAPR